METLNTRLAALRTDKDAKRNPAWTAIMDGATKDLRASGILDGVLSVGDSAPMFARPDVHGKTLRLRSILHRGPVVMSFFRGRW